jgi:uncharacterized protein involved in type VI secretion and phage assembly
MPLAAEQHVSGLQVIVEGNELDPSLRDRLLEVRVRDNLALPDTALVRISDPRGQQVDSHPLQLGKRLEVRTGAIADRATATIFKGKIAAVEPEFTQTGCVIAVRAYDLSHDLHRSRRTRTFQNESADNMVRKVLSEAGLTPGQIQPTGVVHEFFQQSNETDFAFAQRLALMHDYEFLVDDSTFHFRPAARGQGGAVRLRWPQELLSFRPRVSGAEQVDEVEVRTQNPADKRVISVRARSAETNAALGVSRGQVASASGGGGVLVADRIANSRGEADAIAKATLDRMADSFFEAEGLAHGMPDIRAGRKVRIEQVGSAFSGEYVVSASTHLYRGGHGYQTSFTIAGRSARSLLDLMHPPQQRDWAASLVVGVVTNNNDPEQMGRVRVKYPSLSDRDESAWARVATPSSGNGRGMLMLPQVDEEVVVGFEHGDTRRPFVLGSVFNGRDKPGDDLYQTRDGSFALASDKKIWAKAKDDVQITSEKNMTLEIKENRTEKVGGNATSEATGNGTLKGQTYTIEAGSSLTLKGVSITVEASASLKLKGATVDIEGSGPVNVKGAIINLG